MAAAAHSGDDDEGGTDLFQAAANKALAAFEERGAYSPVVCDAAALPSICARVQTGQSGRGPRLNKHGIPCCWLVVR
jgi:hypothetical protein